MIEWFLAFLIATIIIVVGTALVWILNQVIDSLPKILLFLELFILLILDAVLIKSAIWG